MKLNIVLFQPEIPQNTGNIARTCSATGSILHLVHPLGFSLDEKHLRRAGLDYWSDLKIYQYDNDASFFEKHSEANILFFSQKGPKNFFDYDLITFAKDEIFLAFGPESTGFDNSFLKSHSNNLVRIPMLENKRSLNLSNCVALAVYETLRQDNFKGLKTQSLLDLNGAQE